MPIYEYVCETCGNEFEVIQKFSDPELKHHDCSPKSKVHRKPSLTSFHLQGGGWYASGYSGGNGGSSGAKPSAAASASKTDAAPAKSDSGSSPKAASTAGAST